jgi:hypothetical protein
MPILYMSSRSFKLPFSTMAHCQIAHRGIVRLQEHRIQQFNFYIRHSLCPFYVYKILTYVKRKAAAGIA